MGIGKRKRFGYPAGRYKPQPEAPQYRNRKKKKITGAGTQFSV